MKDKSEIGYRKGLNFGILIGVAIAAIAFSSYLVIQLSQDECLVTLAYANETGRGQSIITEGLYCEKMATLCESKLFECKYIGKDFYGRENYAFLGECHGR